VTGFRLQPFGGLHATALVGAVAVELDLRRRDLLLPPLERPTFHEIRSLSEALYKRRGEDRAATQRRMGHHSLRQTDGYDEGHELVYEAVVCDLEAHAETTG
jgi:integrase